MKDIDLYDSVLRGMCMIVEDGKVYVDLGQGEKSPATINKKPIVLPDLEYLKDPERDGYHPFHPLCESVVEGQSPTIKYMQKMFKNAVTLHADHLIELVLRVMASEKQPKSTHYHKLIEKVTEGIKAPKVDKSTLSGWDKIRTSMLEKSVVRLTISRDEKIEDARYLRVLNYAHVYEQESLDGTALIFGTKLARKSDKVLLLNLINLVYGSIPSEVGSNDNRPYFAVILRAYAEFVKFYNHVIKSIKDVLVQPVIEDMWIPEIDNLEKYENRTRSLVGNIGNENSNKPKPVKEEVHAPEPPPIYTPEAKAKPAKASGGVSFAELAQNLRGNTQPMAPGGVLLTPAQRRQQQAQASAPALGTQHHNPFAPAQQPTSNPFAPQQNQNPFATQQNQNPFAGQQSNSASLFGNSAPQTSQNGLFTKPNKF